MDRKVNLYTGIAFHPAQQQIYDSKARYKVVACGRRFGKTELAKIMCAEIALAGGPAGYFAPSYKLQDETWNALLDLLAPAMAEKSEQMHKLKLRTGGTIECWSMTNPQSGLGQKYQHIVMDECATGDYKTMWQRTIRPTLSDLHGTAMFISTPRGMNWFYDLYLHGLEKNRDIWPLWESFRFPSSANAEVMTREEIEDNRRSMSAQTFAQEIEAAFISDADAVFRNLENCWFATEQDQAVPGHTYFIGWDVARVNDFSAMAVMDATAHELVKLDVSAGIAFEQQIGRLWALIDAFNPIGIIVEDNANLKLVEDLNQRGWPIIPFHTTMASKMILVDQLALAFERKSIQILKDDELISELQAYGHERLPSGGIRYGAPEDRNDDRVMALMLVNWAVAEEYAGEADFIRFD